ncbi:unnamed protein product [Euphydryas editha]|uniref:Uncharacterized protein n=1 Tax=Euphydryas editha TaxID=104508 RepID=A0AAU9TQ20_EUPED|nr:unnamed protein product [Euphydryas editha]
MTQRKQTTVRFGRKFVRARNGEGVRDSATVKLIGTMSEIVRDGYLLVSTCTSSLLLSVVPTTIKYQSSSFIKKKYEFIHRNNISLKYTCMSSRFLKGSSDRYSRHSKFTDLFRLELNGHANTIDALSFCLKIAFHEMISMDDPFNLTDNVYRECRGAICQGNEFQQRAYSFEWQLVVLDRFNFISRLS